MRLLITVIASSAISAAHAQGTISVTRPAGVGFSVVTGIGSSATLTTHPAPPPPAFTDKARIVGLFPYVPTPTEKKDDSVRDKDRVTVVRPQPAAQTANMIGRDRIESPHDAAFSKDNYFRQQEERARTAR